MNNLDLAESIKRSVTMRQAVEFYGFHPDRAGFIQCPFHVGDDHGSLKVYDGGGGWHCFGCSAGGSVIDFVMRLFDIGFRQACVQLNADFSLCLPIDRKPTLREHQRMKSQFRIAAAIREAEAEKQRQYEQKYHALWDLWTLYDYWKRELAPSNPGCQIDPRYADAARNIDSISYRIDTEL